jgi:hypothetical protein
MDMFFATVTIALTIALISAIFKIFRLEDTIKKQQLKIDKYELNDAYMTKLRNAFKEQYEMALNLKDSDNDNKG